MLKGPFSESIVGRARKAGVVEVEVHDIRKWSTDKHEKLTTRPLEAALAWSWPSNPSSDAIADLKSQRITMK